MNYIIVMKSNSGLNVQGRNYILQAWQNKKEHFVENSFRRIVKDKFHKQDWGRALQKGGAECAKEWRYHIGHKSVLVVRNVIHVASCKGWSWRVESATQADTFSSFQSLSRVWLFAASWTTARQASLSITNFRSPPKPMSIKSEMPSNHLILSSPSPPAINLSQHQGLFQWVSSSHQVAKVREFQLQQQSFQWRPRTDLL